MRLTIRFDDQDRTLFADLVQSEESEAITLHSIKGMLEEAGYKNLTVDSNTISEVIACAQQGKECTIVLKKLADGTVSVAVTSDKRHAYITLTAADGGQPLTLDMITQAIAK